MPASNPFWLFIQELSSRAIISGYTCGGANKRCAAGQPALFSLGALLAPTFAWRLVGRLGQGVLAGGISAVARPYGATMNGAARSQPRCAL